MLVTGKLFGVIVCGSKRSEVSYAPDEIKQLAAIAREDASPPRSGSSGSPNAYDLATGVAYHGFLNFTRDKAMLPTLLEQNSRRGPDSIVATVWFFQSVEHVDGDAGYEQYLQHHPSTSARVTHSERHFASDPVRLRYFRKVARVERVARNR